MSGLSDFSLTWAEIVKLLLDNWTPARETEYVPVQESLGRVAAKAVRSHNTLPVSRISGADGIAVRSADFKDGIPDTSAWLKNVNFAQADTGDDIPDEFDTVIPVEEICFDDNGKLGFTEEFEYEKNSYVRPAGCMIQNGGAIVSANTRLTPMLLSALALGGLYQIHVLRRPKVVYIPTGNELIPVGQKPMRGQHIETNGLMVSALLKEYGAEAVCFPIIRDDPASLEATLNIALASADIVLINGGSSKGVDDFNARMLKSHADIFYHGVKCAPGRPVAVSLINGKPVINLPGPPLATFLAMEWCVRALVYHWHGLPFPERQTVKARLESPIRKPAEFAEYEFIIRLVISRNGNGYAAKPVGPLSQLAALTVPNALFVVPVGVSGYNEGDEIDAGLLCGTEYLQ